jgi:NAD(P)H-dependent flavin oxidoreductase YrpB (nitropropane dioxygenase family)
VVTTAVDGYPQRVVRTGFSDRLERAGPVGRLLAAWRHAKAFSDITDSSLLSLMREGWQMSKDSKLTMAQTAMAANAPMLTRATLVEGRVDAGILPTGQVVGLIDALPTVAELIDEIVAEAEQTLARLAASANPPTERAGAGVDGEEEAS